MREVSDGQQPSFQEVPSITHRTWISRTSTHDSWSPECPWGLSQAWGEGSQFLGLPDVSLGGQRPRLPILVKRSLPPKARSVRDTGQDSIASGGDYGLQRHSTDPQMKRDGENLIALSLSEAEEKNIFADGGELETRIPEPKVSNS